MTLLRNQLIGLVKLIKSAEGTEDEIDNYLKILSVNVPDPNISDLIFHHTPELDAEEIVDRALAYRPICL